MYKVYRLVSRMHATVDQDPYLFAHAKCTRCMHAYIDYRVLIKEMCSEKRCHGATFVLAGTALASFCPSNLCPLTSPSSDNPLWVSLHHGDPDQSGQSFIAQWLDPAVSRSSYPGKIESLLNQVWGRFNEDHKTWFYVNKNAPGGPKSQWTQ